MELLLCASSYYIGAVYMAQPRQLNEALQCGIVDINRDRKGILCPL